MAGIRWLALSLALVFVPTAAAGGPLARRPGRTARTARTSRRRLDRPRGVAGRRQRRAAVPFECRLQAGKDSTARRRGGVQPSDPFVEDDRECAGRHRLRARGRTDRTHGLHPQDRRLRPAASAARVPRVLARTGSLAAATSAAPCQPVRVLHARRRRAATRRVPQSHTRVYDRVPAAGPRSRAIRCRPPTRANCCSAADA
jgi:hypothetical protein